MDNVYALLAWLPDNTTTLCVRAQAKVKAFSQIAIAPSARLGYQSIVTCHGLGAMNANTVVIPFVSPEAMAQTSHKKMDTVRVCLWLSLIHI